MKYKIPYKWELIILLWLAFFFHQADRQIFNVVLPAIRDDLNLSDSDMGLIAAVVTIVYGILVPVGGFIGDRFNKKYLIIISLSIWTSATLFTGMSTLLFHLILLRGVFTGGAEAFYAPPANAMIGEHHEKTRSTAMSIHQTALYVGIVFSGLLAGWIADTYTWRHAFYMFGIAGIVLAVILYFRMKNSFPYTDINSEINEKIRFLDGLRYFVKKPTAILLTIAFSGMVFVNVGFMTWMPTYLHEDFGFSLTRAGFDSSFYHYILAFFGVLFGARVADRMSQRKIGIRGTVQGLGLLIGAPFIFIMGYSQNTLIVYFGLALFGFFRGIYDSNIFASLFDVIENKYRSTATGIMLMFAFIIGSIAPYILGVLKPSLGLSQGLASLSVVYLISALFIFIAVKFYYKKDYVDLTAS